MLEVAVYTLHRFPGIASAHMAAETLVSGTNVLHRKAVLFDPLAEFAELSLHGPHSSPAHFPKDPAGLRQNEFGLEKYDPAGYRPNFGLALV